MKRADFIKIIKLRSYWKIDRRKGNYVLPNGKRLSNYIEHLVRSQMEIDSLKITSNGDLAVSTGGKWNSEIGDFDEYVLMPFGNMNEHCPYDQMQIRIKYLVHDIIGY